MAVGAATRTRWLWLAAHPTRGVALAFAVVVTLGTVGLSTGITGGLPAAGQLTIIALMFIGRVGPITLASALALRRRDRRHTLPEERPVIG
ncbi:potassium transporter TrkG [Streptomyces sp. CA-288835]|uniref:potassium transporter TrkG n=1 Tax=Streptomyces sp. CA-288835 TaxID=3240069 RepID=UPI003D94C804